jgi:hypothetical protein
LLNIATLDFLLFGRVNSELADLSLSQDSLKTSLWEVVQAITKYKSSDAIQQWMDFC